MQIGLTPVHALLSKAAAPPSHGDLFAVNLAAQREQFQKLPRADELNEKLQRMQSYVAELQARGSRCVFHEMPIDSSLRNSPRAVCIRERLLQAFPPGAFRWIFPEQIDYAHQRRRAPPPERAREIRALSWPRRAAGTEPGAQAAASGAGAAGFSLAVRAVWKSCNCCTTSGPALEHGFGQLFKMRRIALAQLGERHHHREGIVDVVLHLTKLLVELLQILHESCERSDMAFTSGGWDIGCDLLAG